MLMFILSIARAIQLMLAVSILVSLLVGTVSFVSGKRLEENKQLS